MRFLDTNIFIRLISGDDPRKTRACLALFEQLRAGLELATTSESVIAEVVYILSSKKHYGMARNDIRDGLAHLLNIDGLRLAARSTYVRALDVYATHRALDFEDALTVAHMEREGVTELHSYDRGFDEVPGITRIEP